MAEAKWQSDFGFGIDNGELDEMDRKECFVLGVEIGMLYEELKWTFGFAVPVHAANEDRIRRLMEKYGRDYTLTHSSDDVSESWMNLTVMEKDPWEVK